MAARLLAGACMLSLSWSFAAPFSREQHFFASKSQAGPSLVQRAATVNNMDTTRSPQVLMQDAVKLLREVAEVATSTGMETGLRRGLQAAQAAAATAAEVAQQPPSQLDEAFVAKVLRKLFEKLLGGNFQTSLEVQSPFFIDWLVSEEPLFFIRGKIIIQKEAHVLNGG